VEGWTRAGHGAALWSPSPVRYGPRDDRGPPRATSGNRSYNSINPRPSTQSERVTESPPIDGHGTARSRGGTTGDSAKNPESPPAYPNAHWRLVMPTAPKTPAGGYSSPESPGYVISPGETALQTSTHRRGKGRTRAKTHAFARIQKPLEHGRVQSSSIQALAGTSPPSP